MLTTGLRSIEIRRAKRKDFILQHDQWILYIQGKGRLEADEFVKVTPRLSEAIHSYLQKRQDNNPYLFIPHSNKSRTGQLSRSFFKRMFQRILVECGIEQEGLTPHVLRHAAATFNLLRGGSLEATKQLLRHSSIDTTLIYAHHIDRMKDDSEQQIEQFILKEESCEGEMVEFVLLTEKTSL
jgi:integrase